VRARGARPGTSGRLRRSASGARTRVHGM